MILAKLFKNASPVSERIANAERGLQAAEESRAAIQSSRAAALAAGDMAAAETADDQMLAADRSAKRFRDLLDLLRTEAAKLAEDERQAAIAARVELGQRAVLAGREAAKEIDGMAKAMAGKLRFVEAAETFAQDVTRETGQAIGSIYEGFVLPPTTERVRFSSWRAVDEAGTVHAATSVTRGPNSEPKPRHDHVIDHDDRGRARFARWRLDEWFEEIQNRPSQWPGMLVEIDLPALQAGVPPHWSEETRAVASNDAEAIVMAALKRAS